MRGILSKIGDLWRPLLALLLFVLAILPLVQDKPPAESPVPTRATPAPAATYTKMVADAVAAHRVFVTTDMSSDDVVALLYLLRHPDVEVLGIGSANGVAHVEPAARNVLRLLALVGRTDIPVAVGSDTPLEGDHAFPAAWRGGADRLFGLTVPEASSTLSAESTSQLLAEVVNAHPHEVVVVLLGAHTDLALALRADPSLAGRIQAVHLMGGAVNVPGNIHAEYALVDNESAEWNIWLDYRAAAEVFGFGIPLTVVPLDATNKVRMARADVEQFVSQAQAPAAQAVAQLWKSQAGSFYIWDAVAAVALTLPQAARWEQQALTIVTDRPKDLGQTLLQAGQRPNTRVCVEVNVSALQEELVRVLNR